MCLCVLSYKIINIVQGSGIFVLMIFEVDEKKCSVFDACIMCNLHIRVYN